MPVDPSEQATLTAAPATEDPIFSDGTLFGPYRILGKLGEGGMGMVYHAVQGTLERHVALKVMRPELLKEAGFAERFLREARAAASVCHQNTVLIFDAGTIEGRLYMAFQYVEGGDLDALLKAQERFDPARAAELVADCAAGLEALAEAGLVHRDIKPHNIFLDAKGRPRLGDFGLARRAEGSDRMTVTGVGMGTPAYMSPEQAQGLGEIDVRADIHALGGTLYTLVTGKPPFGGATAWAVVNAVVNEPAPDPRMEDPRLPEGLAAVVLKAMAKRPEDRYQSPGELRADLLRLVDALRGGRGQVAGALPLMPGDSPLGPFAGRAWLWPVGYAAATALLPLVLGPLTGVNPDFTTQGWDKPTFWALWLGGIALNVLLLWLPLRLLQTGRCGRWGLALPGALALVACGLLPWAAVRAVVDVAGGDGGWELFPILAGLIGLGIGGWWLIGPWWRIETSALLRRAAVRPLQVGAVALLVVVICHLVAAQHGVARTWEESSGIFQSRRTVTTIRHPTWATGALLALVPGLLAWVPFLLVVRGRRRI